MAFNVVELAASGEESEEQKCRFGHLVTGHAVYCHNDGWEDSPRKCRRTWYTNGQVKDEECPGFEKNPDFKGEFVQINQPVAPCSQCKGRKLIDTEGNGRNNTATCPLCVGSGEEPGPISLTTYEQNTLEMGTVHSGRRGTAAHSFVRIAENKEHSDSIQKMTKLELVVIRSIQWGKGLTIYMLENTLKGEATMRANWKAKKTSMGPEA